jgi:hypothetical protein
LVTYNFSATPKHSRDICTFEDTQLSKHQSFDLKFLLKPRASDVSLAVVEMIYFDYDQDSMTWLRGVLVRLVRYRFSTQPPDSVLPDQGILQKLLAIYNVPLVAQQQNGVLVLWSNS